MGLRRANTLLTSRVGFSGSADRIDQIPDGSRPPSRKITMASRGFPATARPSCCSYNCHFDEGILPFIVDDGDFDLVDFCGVLSSEEIMSWILSANLNRVIENKSNLPVTHSRFRPGRCQVIWAIVRSFEAVRERERESGLWSVASYVQYDFLSSAEFPEVWRIRCSRHCD